MHFIYINNISCVVGGANDSNSKAVILKSRFWKLFFTFNNAFSQFQRKRFLLPVTYFKLSNLYIFFYSAINIRWSKRFQICFLFHVVHKPNRITTYISQR